jgi:hypothetical protein
MDWEEEPQVPEEPQQAVCEEPQDRPREESQDTVSDALLREYTGLVDEINRLTQLAKNVNGGYSVGCYGTNSSRRISEVGLKPVRRLKGHHLRVHNMCTA